jgi:enamine deaminase RidA (YjgF/YER057c/UK114 family)
MPRAGGLGAPHPRDMWARARGRALFEVNAAAITPASRWKCARQGRAFRIRRGDHRRRRRDPRIRHPVVHAEPEATSNQVVRAVHWGGRPAISSAEIKVARHAQKTDAAQDFKGLLLEAGASANAVPQLEIFADDVKCAHGATVGQLDEAARFYMMARAVDPAHAAQRLLVQAFIGDAFVALEDAAERERPARCRAGGAGGARL